MALKLGDYLTESNLLGRPVWTLKMHDLLGLAEAATAEYTQARSERYVAEEEAETNELPSTPRDLLGI